MSPSKTHRHEEGHGGKASTNTGLNRTKAEPNLNSTGVRTDRVMSKKKGEKKEKNPERNVS